MILFSSVAFGGVTGDVGGKPFVPKGILATKGNLPGSLALVLADKPLDCGTEPSAEHLFVMVGYEAKKGGKAEPIAVVGRKSTDTFAMAQATGSLDVLATKKGDKGKASFVVTSKLGTIEAKDVEFVLCEDVAVLKPPSGPFVETTLKLDDGKRTVKAKVPEGWKQDTWVGAERFTGPDGKTTVSLDTTCAGGCSFESFPGNAKGYADSQVNGWKSAQTDAKVLVSEAVGESGWKAIWTRWGEGFPKTWHGAYMRWSKDWDHMVICKVDTVEEYEAFGKEWLDVCQSAEIVP